MFSIHLAFADSIWDVDLWYALPAILAVSLVYDATRHEEMRPILIHASHWCLWIVSLMVAVFAVMQFSRWCFP